MRRNENVDEFAKKGEEIYEKKLKRKLEKSHRGKIIVIDVDSGDYFWGSTGLEATRRAREKYPNKIFYAKRIGYKAVHVMYKGKR